MPNRGRRVAARQAQIGLKRKKSRGPSGIPTEPRPNVTNQAPPNTNALGTPVTAPRPTPIRRTDPRPAVYSYIGPEIRRILLLGGIIIAILVALTLIID